MVKKLSLLLILVLLAINSFGSDVLASELDEDEITGNDFAQITLKNISNRAYSRRMISGKSYLSLGVGSIILGGISGRSRLTNVGIGTGVLLGGVGMWNLFIPSSIEKEYQGISSYPIGEREIGAMDSLSYLADRAKRIRITRGIISSGASLYFLAHTQSSTDVDYENYLGLIFAGDAIYQFTSSYYPEKAYQKVKDYRKNHSFNLSLGNFNGAVLSYQF